VNDDLINEVMSELVPPGDVTRRDWSDVIDRARVLSKLDEGGNTRRWPFSIPRGSRRVTLAIATSVIAGAAAAGAFALHASGPSPGLTAGVSSLERLPRITVLPKDVSRQLAVVAPSAGISAAEADERARLLRSGLPQGDLYAFRGSGGKICFVLSGHLAVCPRSLSEGDDGLVSAISGGYPNETPALVGVVADNVSEVVLIVGDARFAVPIVNNSIYVKLPQVGAASGFALHLGFDDGNARTVPLANVYADH
jgi:hypothetical protein